MTVSGFTLVSRILGFLRDVILMWLLGVSMVTDAFFAAFRFPNMFRRIFGEGAFNAAFVPLFGRKLAREDRSAALDFARNAFSSLLAVLGVLTVVAIPCMHWIMAAVVPGFLPKFERDLAHVGAGHADYRININTRGARDVYFQIEGRSSSAAGHWTNRVGIENLRLVEKGRPATPVLPGDFELEGLKPAAGAYRLAADGLGRIVLPKGHRFSRLEGRMVVSRSKATVPRAWIRVYRNHPDTFGLTVQLSRIMFCYLLFMALAAQLSGVLNTFRVFGMPAAAPIILNLTLLAGLLLIWKLELVPGPVLAWAVAVAGFLQFAALWANCWLQKAPMFVVRPSWTPELKRLMILMGPGVLAAGIQQVNLLVGNVIASFQEGAISFIYLADRVNQLPLGVIGIALGVVLLPEVTRKLRSGREREAAESITKGMEFAMLLTAPAAVAMIVINQELISAIFQRGKFNPDDALKTGWALAGFALGLPGYVLVKVLQPGYFAREDTKSPMIMAGITVAANIVCSLILFTALRPTGYGHVGIALATAIAAWVNVCLLWRGLRGFIPIGKQDRRKLIRILLASIIMGAAVWAGARALAPWFAGEAWLRLGALALVVGFGATVYALLAVLLKATTIAELKEGLGKK